MTWILIPTSRPRHHYQAPHIHVGNLNRHMLLPNQLQLSSGNQDICLRYLSNFSLCPRINENHYNLESVKNKRASNRLWVPHYHVRFTFFVDTLNLKTNESM